MTKKYVYTFGNGKAEGKGAEVEVREKDFPKILKKLVAHPNIASKEWVVRQYDHEVQGGHPEIGYNIMKKFGFADEIAYQCIGHHEDRPKSVEAMLVKAADAISGGRPGARKETYEQYVKRLTDLEQIANQFKGVEKTYAIQAGRELRVFVQPEAIDDLAAYKLAKDIAMKIEAELAYPGEIKVTIIRETRVIEYAR